MKRMLTLFILALSLALRLSAPVNNCLVIPAGEVINPYLPFSFVILQVESDGDTWAFNFKEQACGPFQERPIRIADYNKRTGSNYKTWDAFDYDIALKIYLYYAVKHQPWECEKIARKWNGGDEGMKKTSTLKYWHEVKNRLLQISIGTELNKS